MLKDDDHHFREMFKWIQQRDVYSSKVKLKKEKIAHLSTRRRDATFKGMKN